MTVSNSCSVQCCNYRGKRLLNTCKKGNNWGSSNAKASPSLEQLLFCPPTDVLLPKDTMVRSLVCLMNVQVRCFLPGTPRLHLQYVRSLGHRGKITPTLYCLALKGYICLFSLEVWETFPASKLAMQISSNLLKGGS